MIKNSSKQTGSAHVIIIVILVIALLGALSFVFWQKFIQSPVAQVNQEDTKQLCAGESVEQNGVFCSEGIGVEFKTPDVFAGKFQKEKDYDVYQGSMESSTGSLAGKSLEYYQAVVASGDETLSLSVAKEPIRSGYSSIGHSLQKTYFNATSSSLHLVKSPTQEYDSTTDTMKTTGSWSAGEPVPSFETDEKTKVYYGKVGDAGVVEDGYLMVVGDHLVVIKIKHTTNPMQKSTLDSKKPFSDLNSYLEQLKILK